VVRGAAGAPDAEGQRMSATASPLVVSGPVPPEATAIAVLRQALLTYLPSGAQVVRGQMNLVPEPNGADFLVLWPVSQIALEYPTETYVDVFPETPSITTIMQPYELVLQVDVHGPNSGNTATILQALSRSMSFYDTMASLSADVTLLCIDDPRQSPFENAEQQTEWRWTIDMHLQVNATVTLTQEFFGEVDVGVFSVDVVYPP
jgi:hypothetical protein